MQHRLISDWITDAGLTGLGEHDILAGFCTRVVAAGIPLMRAAVIIDTLHPVHEGHLFRWQKDREAESEIMELGRSVHDAELQASWQRSPFHHLLSTGGTMLRRRLADDDCPNDFPILADLREQGATDYVVFCAHFTERGRLGEMDSVHASIISHEHGGFSEADVALIAALFPALALALKSASMQRIVATLTETYLGRDASRSVLRGRIERGLADRMRAVIWFSDLRDYTRFSDTAPPEAIMPLLNDYAEAVISAVHEAGGDVLKLIGDGTLAIFRADEDASACRQALTAERLVRERLALLDAERTQQGLAVSQAYVGLHVGDVFFGNIGSHDRLDFTVIGPAVNLASRVAAMCRSADRTMLMSSDFVGAVPPDLMADIVSVGRYGLRGFERGEELFTRVRS